jgi:HEAT repeat protein
LALLDDDHEEVRAAVVDALGSLRDPRARQALIDMLSRPWRHQYARVVEAIRRHGTDAIEALIGRARLAPEDRLVAADLFGLVRAPQALDLLVDWLSTPEAPLRAAAIRSLGAIGLDDRAYFFALRALTDESPDVRAAAARALGRARRADGSPYLEPLLDDEWAVAAQAAAALKQLGAPGQIALRRRASEQSQAGDLARQMLWERQPRV